MNPLANFSLDDGALKNRRLFEPHDDRI